MTGRGDLRDRLAQKREVERRIDALDIFPEPVGADREALLRDLIALIQSPWAMTTAGSRARIRTVADRLEGKWPC